MKTRLLGTAVAALLLIPAALRPVAAQDGPVQPYRANDGSVTSLNVLPPGQGRYLNSAELAAAQAGGEQPAHNTDQLRLYESIIQGAPDVTADTLDQYFKDASFGVKEGDVASEYEPRAGTVVVRDTSYGVPHVYGQTRADVMFGAGYVTGEDRLFMIDTLRHVGRGRTSEFLGASPANLAMDRAAYRSSGYTEEELQAMIDRLTDVDPELGKIVQEDVTAYTAGINQYIEEVSTDPSKLPGEYVALQQAPEPWLETDTVAVASLIGSQLGVGGGEELSNAAFVAALEQEGHSRKKALSILRDLKFTDDPEAPVTIKKRFPYLTDLGKVNPRSVALPDDASAAASSAELADAPARIDGPFGPIRMGFPDGASNALLVGAKASKTGRPLAVMGPQTGYWSPEILMEMDLHGPGIHTRGVGFPGISLYTLLGRGADYAWSATSANGDQVDIFAERLCNPDGGEVTEDSTHYLKSGKCTEMYTRTDEWAAKPSAGGMPDPSQPSVTVSMTTQRTDNGIVQARGTVDGKPVAFVAQRASFGKEVDSALTYVEISDPSKINGAKDFQRAFARFTFTFNWFYVDGKDIAYQLGGAHPQRAKGVEPNLPTWGDTGKWQWRGVLSFAETPKAISPKTGYMTSWNNKQAPGWGAADGQYGFGSVHRVLPLTDGLERYIKRGKKMTLTDVVNVMGDAATVDLRGYAVLPWMLKALGKPSNDEMKTAIDLLKAWHGSGSHRRDKDEDGSYENAAAVALMDQWWPRATEAVLRPVLGNAYAALPFGIDDKPGPVGSAYISGTYGHLQKDLRTILGERVKGKLSRVYCGKGKLKACRADLQKSLADSIDALTSEFGADPSTWNPDEGVDSVVFTPVGVQGQRAMQWLNRPTFQQAVEFRP
ncbi:MAG TPA: penicillin acylase family protein [Actinomycetota bacterium]